MLSLSKNQIPEHLRNYFKPKRVYKPKDDMMIPHRVFDALMADGWYGRMDICWSKLNPMPESVTDRPTKAHEYLFLLTKKPRYFYDAEAIKERGADSSLSRLSQNVEGQAGSTRANGGATTNGTMKAVGDASIGRNRRSVWTITTRPYKGAHFATFPPALIEPCIKAGTSERGVCEECGAPWERVVERSGYDRAGRANGSVYTGNAYGAHPQSRPRGPAMNFGQPKAKTVGFRPTCSCNADTIPATVLDPFMGSGTTAHTARRLGRRSVGLELDSRCGELVRERMGNQGVLL